MLRWDKIKKNEINQNDMNKVYCLEQSPTALKLAKNYLWKTHAEQQETFLSHSERINRKTNSHLLWLDTVIFIQLNLFACTLIAA